MNIHANVRFRFDHWLPKVLGVTAITLYPYIFFDAPFGEHYKNTIRHELEHVRQVREFGWVRFYLSYLLYYLAERVKGEDHYQAYLNIPWEVEAREKEREYEPV